MKKVLLFFTALFLVEVVANAQSIKTFEVLNPRVEQGGVLIVRTAPQGVLPATSHPVISFYGVRYKLNKYGEVFIGVNTDIRPQKYIVTFIENNAKSSWDYQEIEVIKKEFPTRNRAPFTPTRKWQQERDIIRQAFSRGDYSEKYFDGEFIRPLDRIVIDAGRIVGDPSSPFGEGHAGVDLITLDRKTRKHERPVKAINSGKVALIAKNFATEGNMVILDHGSGIFSVYMHLAKFSVKKVGDNVKGGDVIGISGRSGSAASGGPHLHFAVKIRDSDGTNDIYVDPLAFIETMNQHPIP